VLESKVYNQTFQPTWSLSDEQNQKTRFNNTMTGYRLATSVGGAGTGEGGDFIVVDDPIKASEAESEVRRQNVIDWWDNEMSTRGNNPETVAKVIIMQRLHANDLAGHCIKQGGYEVLRLPAEYDGKKSVTCIGWEDPRNTLGELLWPERFSKETINDLKRQLGSRGTASQLQQDPKAAEDGLFKRKWWKTYNQLPLAGQRKRVVQFWDTAQKPGISNDYSVCATWIETQSGFYLADVLRAKLEYPQLKAAIKMQQAKWNATAVQIEDKGSGISLIQDLRQETSLPIVAYDPGQNDKQVRAAAATPTVEAGNCFLPEDASWTEDFIREHEQFPDGDNDDQVDTTSQMAEYFNRQRAYNPRVRTL
jgi:predicted phage terminase large subunit-like protein